MITSNEWMQKAGELEAEVERLRLQDEGNARMVEIAQAELERLSGIATVLQVSNDSLRGEVEQLKRPRCDANEDHVARAELERLREENETYVSNYDRLYARLHRIEEAARLIADQGQGLEEYDALRAALEEKP